MQNCNFTKSYWIQLITLQLRPNSLKVIGLKIYQTNRTAAFAVKFYSNGKFYTMTKYFLKLVIASLFIFCGHYCMAQINTGEIMFIGFNADGTDGFSIVALADIPASSTIYFTDNEWNELAIGAGGAFNDAAEGELTWSTGASIINAGTVINFIATGSTSDPSYGSFSGSGPALGIISGRIDLNIDNEVLYAFLGSDNITPTTFLSAIATGGFTTARGSLINTGLTAGTNAIDIPGNEDVMVYTGSTDCSTTRAACAADITNSANWSTEDGSGDQSIDGGIDFPSSVPTSFGGTALPVELISFNGKVVDGTIHLTWKTASELNNDYFEIYRSENGLDFDKVGKVSGKGTTYATSNYQFIDQPGFDNHEFYYRLVQVDYDGGIEAFPTILVVGANLLSGSSIFPNPAYDILNIRTESPPLLARLIDSSGRLVRSFSLSDLSTSIDISEVKSGNYLLSIDFSTHTELVRIIKK